MYSNNNMFYTFSISNNYLSSSNAEYGYNETIKEKNKEVGFVYADKQTKGRGTYGRKWVSNKGNLFGSIFFLVACLVFLIPFFRKK